VKVTEGDLRIMRSNRDEVMVKEGDEREISYIFVD